MGRCDLINGLTNEIVLFSYLARPVQSEKEATKKKSMRKNRRVTFEQIGSSFIAFICVQERDVTSIDR